MLFVVYDQDSRLHEIARPRNRRQVRQLFSLNQPIRQRGKSQLRTEGRASRARCALDTFTPSRRRRSSALSPLRYSLRLGTVPRFQHSHPLVAEWEPNCHGHPFSLGAFNCQLPTMFTNDSSDNQKPESAPRRLGCEIRLKYAPKVVCRNTAARVFKTNDDMVRVDVGPNTENPAALHRFHAVLDHVVERLLHLVPINLD